MLEDIHFKAREAIVTRFEAVYKIILSLTYIN